MQQITTSEDIKKLGTILTIWAHPDDETFLAAGILATAVENGQRVVCVTATKGEAGVQNEKRWPANQLGSIRADELNKALKILGLTEHFWLDYKDGYCANAPVDEAVGKIIEIIKSINPNTIITFAPDGWTGHPDHKAVSRWVSEADKNLKNNCHIYHAISSKGAYDNYLKILDEKVNIFFNIEKPTLIDETECNILYQLPDEISIKKINALEAMSSQTENLFSHFDKSFIRKSLSEETFIKAN